MAGDGSANGPGRPAGDERLTSLCISLGREEYDRVDALARELFRSRSQMIRVIVIDWLRRLDEEEGK